MSDYSEKIWRENYYALVGGVRMIREAVEEMLGPAAPVISPERTSSSVEDCEHLAVAIATYAEKTQRRLAELEKICETLREQIALTGRMSVEEIIEEAPSIGGT